MDTDRRTDNISQFTTGDEAANPTRLVEVGDAVGLLPETPRLRHAALDLLRLQPGDLALDLGCGAGDATAELGARVVPGGQVVGVDFSQTMIAEANRRHGGGALPVWFEVGDAQA